MDRQGHPAVMFEAPVEARRRKYGRKHGRHSVPHHRLVAKSKNLPESDVRMDSTFEELQIDSLDKINLSFAVEEMFSIEIPDDALNSLKTVGDVVHGVETLRAAAPPNAAAS